MIATSPKADLLSAIEAWQAARAAADADENNVALEAAADAADAACCAALPEYVRWAAIDGGPDALRDVDKWTAQFAEGDLRSAGMLAGRLADLATAFCREIPAPSFEEGPNPYGVADGMEAAGLFARAADLRAAADYARENPAWLRMPAHSSLGKMLRREEGFRRVAAQMAPLGLPAEAARAAAEAMERVGQLPPCADFFPAAYCRGFFDSAEAAFAAFDRIRSEEYDHKILAGRPCHSAADYMAAISAALAAAGEDRFGFNTPSLHGNGAFCESGTGNSAYLVEPAASGGWIIEWAHLKDFRRVARVAKILG